MKDYHFKLQLKYYESGFESLEIYEFQANDYSEFRKEFLKRFGNFVSTNKNNKQKRIVKDLSYIAETVKQFISFVNTNTDFEIKVLSIKNDKPTLNFNPQFYKGIKFQLIERSYHKPSNSEGHAKRFTLNGTNQNVWIPNKYLDDSGTLKINENIDYVFRKSFRQLEIAGYTQGIPGIKRRSVIEDE